MTNTEQFRPHLLHPPAEQNTRRRNVFLCKIRASRLRLDNHLQEKQKTYVYIQYIKVEDAIAAHYKTGKNIGTRIVEPRTNEAKTERVLHEVCGYLVLEETFAHHLEACKIQLRESKKYEPQEKPEPRKEQTNQPKTKTE